MGKWKAKKTLLIVGEGHDEVAFLNHIKQFSNVRGNGVKINIKNARGKGAAHVVDHTIKIIGSVDYDEVAVLLDTDTDWTATVAKRAKSKGIIVLRSETCLEAMLLRVLGQVPAPHSDLKKQFANYVKNDATRPENFETHFNQNTLNAARMFESTIDEILKLYRI